MPEQNQDNLSVVYGGIFLFILLLNVGFSVLIKTQGLFAVQNEFPFGLPVSPLILWLILGFVTWAVFQFKFFTFAPIGSVLLMAGAWSNFTERLLFGSVADYIYLGRSYANLADFQIWVGVILINLVVWGVLDNRELSIENSDEPAAA